MIRHPSASFGFTARCRLVNRPGIVPSVFNRAVAPAVAAAVVAAAERSGLARVAVDVVDPLHAEEPPTNP